MVAQRRLGAVARTLKSANAGASRLTFDMFFDSVEDLRAAVAALRPRTVGRLYGVAPDSVEVYSLEHILAVKVTIPRASSQGSVDERDFDGVQQHVHLLDVPL